MDKRNFYEEILGAQFTPSMKLVMRNLRYS